MNATLVFTVRMPFTVKLKVEELVRIRYSILIRENNYSK